MDATACFHTHQLGNTYGNTCAQQLLSILGFAAGAAAAAAAAGDGGMLPKWQIKCQA